MVFAVAPTMYQKMPHCLKMREEDIGPGAAVLRCAVARGHVTGAERQRAYAMGDLQTRHVSVCYVPHV